MCGRHSDSQYHSPIFIFVEKKKLAKGLEACKRQDAPLMSGGESAENAHVAHVKRSRPCSSDSGRTTVVTRSHRY